MHAMKGEVGAWEHADVAGFVYLLNRIKDEKTIFKKRQDRENIVHKSLQGENNPLKYASLLDTRNKSHIING